MGNNTSNGKNGRNHRTRSKSTSDSHNKKMNNSATKSYDNSDMLGRSSLKSEGDSSDKKMAKGTSNSESDRDKIDSNPLESSNDKEIASTSDESESFNMDSNPLESSNINDKEIVSTSDESESFKMDSNPLESSNDKEIVSTSDESESFKMDSNPLESSNDKEIVSTSDESESFKMDSNPLENSNDKEIVSTSESDNEEDSAMKSDEPLHYHNNGVSFIKKVKRSGLGMQFPQKFKNVIGLDFGTSTIAVCYVTSASDNVYQFKLQEEDVDFYTPTVLLIDKHNKVEIGSRALRRYTRLEVDVNSIFFDKVKLKLQHNKSVNRETTIKSSNGMEYYLIEVIAIILRKIKEKLIIFFKNREGGYKIGDFDWVVTVPALWGVRARDMMREAAYLAGLCSDLPDGLHYLPLVPLQPASNHHVSQIDINCTALELNPHKLSLVFEPEAAAVACMKLETDPSISPPGPNDCYLTVDIGGGTIDITAHQVHEDGTLKILDIPHGRVYGGTEVNKKFEEFIGKEVFHDPCYLKLKRNEDCEHKEQHSPQLLGFINKDFEEVKKNFGSENEVDIQFDDSQTCYNVSIPPPLIEVYRNDLNAIRGNSTRVSYIRTAQLMSINKAMLKELFEDNVTAIRECIDDVITVVGRDNVKIIYLVGGFGGCQYITSCIRYYYPNLSIVRPFEPEYAVAKGACLFYKEQVLRIADATYGTGTSVEYNECNPAHKPAFKLLVDDCEYCNNLFQPYIHKGDEIKPDIVYSGTFIPIYEHQITVSFTLYSTPEHYIDHVKKEDGSLPDNLEKIGYLNVDISSGMHLSCEEREVQLVLDFSSTEIHAYGWFVHDKDSKPVKATCDFLSTIDNVKKFTT